MYWYVSCIMVSTLTTLYDQIVSKVHKLSLYLKIESFFGIHSITIIIIIHHEVQRLKGGLFLPQCSSCPVIFKVGVQAQVIVFLSKYYKRMDTYIQINI